MLMPAAASFGVGAIRPEAALHFGMWIACAQAGTEQSGVGEHLGGAAAGARAHALDLDGALAEVGVDAQAERRGRPGDLAQEPLRAGVDRVRADVGRHARMGAPALVQRERTVERATADRGVEAPLAMRDACEVDVVHAPARREPHAHLRHRLGGRVGVHEVVADQRGAEQHHLQRAEPGDRAGLLGRHVGALRDAGRVRRREAEVDRDATDHRQDRVVVDVDEAGHDDAAGQPQRLGRRDPRGRRGAEPGDAAVEHADRGAAQLGADRIDGQHVDVEQQQVEPGGRRHRGDTRGGGRAGGCHPVDHPLRSGQPNYSRLVGRCKRASRRDRTGGTPHRAPRPMKAR
jgi:hypothetical protein